MARRKPDLLLVLVIIASLGVIFSTRADDRRNDIQISAATLVTPNDAHTSLALRQTAARSALRTR